MAVGPLHLSPVNKKGLPRGLVLPEVQNQFFCLVHVEDQFVHLTIDKNVINKGPVPRLVPPCDEAQDGDVIRVLYDDGVVQGGEAGVCVQGEQFWTETAALW